MGHPVKRNESVTLTCQIVASDAMPGNFAWFKRTFGSSLELSGPDIRSWTQGEYLYGSLTLNNYNYSDCGVYSCRIATGVVTQEIEMPVTIEGMTFLR